MVDKDLSFVHHQCFIFKSTISEDIDVVLESRKEITLHFHTFH